MKMQTTIGLVGPSCGAALQLHAGRCGAVALCCCCAAVAAWLAAVGRGVRRTLQVEGGGECMKEDGLVG